MSYTRFPPPEDVPINLYVGHSMELTVDTDYETPLEGDKVTLNIATNGMFDGCDELYVVTDFNGIVEAWEAIEEDGRISFKLPKHLIAKQSRIYVKIIGTSSSKYGANAVIEDGHLILSKSSTSISNNTLVVMDKNSHFIFLASEEEMTSEDVLATIFTNNSDHIILSIKKDNFESEWSDNGIEIGSWYDRRVGTCC